MSKRLEITRDVSFDITPSDETKLDGRTISGYVAVFDQDTRINSFEGNFTERISPGAFKKTLEGRKPVMQYNHGKDARVGSTPIGVYEELREDETGVFAKGRLFDNQMVEPVRQAVEAQAISGQSITFEVIRDEWRDSQGRQITGRELSKKLFDTRDGGLQRTIKEIRLREAGPVLYPAYESTTVGVRSAEDLNVTERDEIVAEYIRSSGLKVETRDEAPEGDVKPEEGNGDTWANEGGALPPEDEEKRADDPKKPYGDVT